MPHLSARKARRNKRATRPETRLVLATITNAKDGDDMLQSLIDEWLVPRLIDEFVRERELDSSPKGIAPHMQEPLKEGRRAA
jgi:hypothetical protein